MKVISVAGATSKAGKTLLAEQLIRYCMQRYSPVYAVKFTTTTDLPFPCPRGAPCTVCDLSDLFRTIRDPEVLQQKGKNTARFCAANPGEILSHSDFVVMNRRARMSDHPELLVPNGTLSLDLSQTPATEIPEIRNKIDSVIQSVDHVLQG